MDNTLKKIGMFYSKYYKVESNSGIFGEIYVMVSDCQTKVVEIEVIKSIYKKNELLYSFLFTANFAATPYLFLNHYDNNGIENYKEISKESFLKVFDECVKQHREHCL